MSVNSHRRDRTAVSERYKVVFATPSYRIDDADWRFIVYHDPQSVVGTRMQNGNLELVFGPENHTSFEWKAPDGRWVSIDEFAGDHAHARLVDRLSSITADHLDEVTAALLSNKPDYTPQKTGAQFRDPANIHARRRSVAAQGRMS